MRASIMDPMEVPGGTTQSSRMSGAPMDQLLSVADPNTAFDPNGLLDDLKKAFAERALNAGMDHHLAGDEAGNSRNG